MSTETKRKPVQFFAVAPIQAGKVDRDAGILRDVALMSIGPAAGHGSEVDAKTLTMLFELANGKSVKAFDNHSWNPSPTEAVGLFSGVHIDNEAGVLRASQFSALNSFKTHNKAAFETMFELAEKAPDSFGISLSLYCDYAWPMEDGTEMLTDGYCFSKPAGAVGESPKIRPSFIESADFVSSPAANVALFSKDNVDADANRIQKPDTTDNKKPQFFKMKSVFSHFKDKPKALAHIAKFAQEATATTTDEEIIKKVELAMSEEEQAAIVVERDKLKADILERDAKIADLEKQIADIKPKADGAAEFSKKNEDLNRELDGYKRKYSRFGIPPVDTGSKNEQTNAPLTKTTTEFYSMSHKDRMEFSCKGGRIVDAAAA